MPAADAANAFEIGDAIAVSWVTDIPFLMVHVERARRWNLPRAVASAH